MGVAEFDQAGAFGVAGGAWFEADSTQGIRTTIGEAHGGVYLEVESVGGYLAALAPARPMNRLDV